MSGIAGIFHFDGAPVTEADLARMGRALKRRGPDGTGYWRESSIGLVWTRLSATAEAASEDLPLHHSETGCVVTADARLDNREDLSAALGLDLGATTRSDGSLILESYLRWGEACVGRLLGDFAFALWDPRSHLLFCARDHLGVKPFCYYRDDALAIISSEPPAIASHPRVPYRLNEARIGDFLVNPLEGVDKTSTFFEGVFRLPPGHSLAVTPASLKVGRYWQPRPQTELRLRDDQAYAEAFLDVLTKAVRCRLRGGTRVGSMLSGGLDSGSIVAIGRTLRKHEMGPPLRTFSGVAADPGGCVETTAIAAVQAMGDIEPVNISHAGLPAQVPGILDATWSIDEPFDNHMTLQRALYVASRDCGLKALLDGVGGDVVLSAGQYVARLLRSGRWWAAVREASGQIHFYGQRTALIKELYQNARVAFVPQWARDLRARSSSGVMERSLAGKLQRSLVNPEFARRIRVSDRLRAVGSLHPAGIRGNSSEELARTIAHPFLTVGRERYERVASALGIEPRDPFLDVRVVEFALSLPCAQRQHRGWPKVILRRATNGMLPDAVRWRRGKEHLGRAFTLSLMRDLGDRMRFEIDRNRGTISALVDMRAVDAAAAAYASEGDPEQAEKFYNVVHLAAWLHRFSCRPQFGDSAES